MANAASELTWLLRLLEELGVKNLKLVKLFCDNQSALHIAKTPVFRERIQRLIGRVAGTCLSAHTLSNC